MHAADVFGRSFDTHQNNLFAFGGLRFSFIGRKYDFTACRSRRGRQPLRDRIGFLRSVESGVQKLV